MTYPTAYQPDEGFAAALDAADPLRGYRDRFHLPTRADGSPLVYFGSHSLGLQPRAARAALDQVLTQWAELGVEGHFTGPRPWYTYQEALREPLARLVGASPGEVVLMNGLTVNLHLLMATFYRPTPGRAKVLLDAPAFPSDLYAVQTQIRYHGYDPADTLLQIAPKPGENALSGTDLEALLTTRGSEIALVLFNGVNFLTGQVYDLERVAALARSRGCAVGFDLAHAAGNVPLRLHDWGVDFAVWCTYKYLCGGPGAVAGGFVHDRHGRAGNLPRLAGWWGNDPATRFRMQLEPEFKPHAGAAGWQVSNPPVLALAPLHAALALFDEAGLPALRAKSECLTGYLMYLLEQFLPGVEVLTPRDPARRGCQVSLRVGPDGRELLNALHRSGVVADFREPDVLRVAPVPLYNTFREVFTFARTLAGHAAV